MGTGFDGQARRWIASWLGIVLGLISAPQPVRADRAAAERLLREAVQAKADERARLLEEAAASSPQWSLPRWHEGQVQREGRWIPVREAQAAAAADPRLVQLEKIRALQEQGPNGWLKLARYCAQHDLDDRAALYWTAVLAAQPTNASALQGLGMRPYKGRLLTDPQIAAWEEAELRYSATREVWLPVLRQWARSLRDGSAEERAAALGQLRGFDDPEAIALLGEAFRDAGVDVLLEIVAALGRIEDVRAAAALVDAAVGSPHESVREAAAECLKDRSYFEYVPMLMEALAAPITVAVSQAPMADGLLTSVRLEREGPTAVVAWTRNFEQTWEERPGGTGPVPARRVPRGWRPNLQIAAATGRADAANAQINAWNARINDVLRKATGVENDGSPQAWWDWWQEYNDVYVPEGKPRYEQQDTVVLVETSAAAGCECFLPGTPVWTETGTIPIERVRIGDRVLAQDAETGELAFKLVLQTTLRPETEALRVGVDGDEIVCTRGHPFWVAGLGWRMARRLEPGMQLHTPGGLKEVRYAEPGPSCEAHNLVVADFNCYFVGRDGVLVHDNTTRRPTRAVLPGIARP